MTWLHLASSILGEAATTEAGAGEERYMHILRLLPVLTQPKKCNAVQEMARIISNPVSASQDIVALLGVLVFPLLRAPRAALGAGRRARG